MRDCSNCAKNDGFGGCLVLTEIQHPCWAWTDNPNWEIEAEEATEEYDRRRRCKHCAYWDAESPYVGKCTANNKTNLMYWNAPGCEDFRMKVE